MLQLYHYPFKASLRAISKIDSAFEYEQNPPHKRNPADHCWLAGSLRRLTLLGYESLLFVSLAETADRINKPQKRNRHKRNEPCDLEEIFRLC